MTREEEMLEAVTKEHGELSKREISVTLTAIKWADEKHGKELMYAIQKTHERTKREDINKACELLMKMIMEVTYKVLEDNSVEHYDKMEFIEDFKKSLEE